MSHVGALKIGLSLALTGRYASMGRQALAALRLLVDETNGQGGIKVGIQRLKVDLVCHDDGSQPDRCGEIYRHLCFDKGADIILSPYGSDLVRVAGAIVEQAGMVMVNHGGAADDIYQAGWRMVVGVLSPASSYFEQLALLIAGLKFWRKRVALVSSPSKFAEAVIEGFRARCSGPAIRRRGVRIRLKRVVARRDPTTLAEIFNQIRQTRSNVLVSAGSFEEDVSLMQAAVESSCNLPVLACVAAGVSAFGRLMGPSADGIVGPSQWEPDAVADPELGPNSSEFARRMAATNPAVGCDYPAAQAYAGALLALEAVRRVGTLDQLKLRQAFNDLRTRTCYGDFAIDPTTGRQIAHKVLLVQWHQGEKVIINPDAHSSRGEIALPSGLHLLLAAYAKVRHTLLGRSPE